MGARPKLDTVVMKALEGARAVKARNQGAPIQGHDGDGNNRNTRLAAFCEAMSHAIHGGTPHPVLERPQPNGNGTYTFIPDLVNTRRRSVIETKGLVYGHSMNIHDRQLTGYLLEQLERPSYRFSFLWIRHGLGPDEVRTGDDHAFFTRLARGPLVAFSFPLSVVKGIREREHDGKTYRNTGNKFTDCTVINPLVQRTIYTATLDALAELGIEPDGYAVEKTRVDRLEVGAYRLDPFPVIKVRERDHDAWFERLCKWEPPSQFDGWR